MYRFDELRELHLELTTRCNARCPMCPRAAPDGDEGHLPAAELSLAEVQAILPPEVVRQLRRIYLCGNYGDALVARDVLPVLAYLRSANPGLDLGLHTNGGARDGAFWAEAARLLSYCRFAIDGLADTNHLYRRGVRWEKVLAAVTAFVGAGGRAEWDFLVFRHNEHQVEAARALASELGFKRFSAKRTNRFPRGEARLAVPGPKGAADAGPDGAVAYHLEEPTRPEWQNPAQVALRSSYPEPGAYRALLGSLPIRCKAACGRAAYLSAEGLAFPCCYTAQLYAPGRPAGQGELAELLASLPGGKAALSAKEHGLRAVVEGPLFQQVLPERWARASLAEGKPEVCARVCGESELNPYRDGAVRA